MYYIFCISLNFCKALLSWKEDIIFIDCMTDKSVYWWCVCIRIQVKSTLAWTKKVSYEDKKDEATVPEMQGLKEDHLEDSLRHSDAQNHELQVRAIEIRIISSNHMLFKWYPNPSNSWRESQIRGFQEMLGFCEYFIWCMSKFDRKSN